MNFVLAGNTGSNFSIGLAFKNRAPAEPGSRALQVIGDAIKSVSMHYFWGQVWTIKSYTATVQTGLAATLSVGESETPQFRNE